MNCSSGTPRWFDSAAKLLNAHRELDREARGFDHRGAVTGNRRRCRCDRAHGQACALSGPPSGILQAPPSSRHPPTPNATWRLRSYFTRRRLQACSSSRAGGNWCEIQNSAGARRGKSAVAPWVFSDRRAYQAGCGQAGDILRRNCGIVGSVRAAPPRQREPLGRRGRMASGVDQLVDEGKADSSRAPRGGGARIVA